MAVSFDIPKQTEDALRAQWGNLEQAAKEALLIESYRAGKISLGLLAKTLDLATSIEAQEWLASHGASLNYSLDDLEADRKTLGHLFDVQL